MMRVVKVFGGGRGGGRIVPCDTGSRWEGTVIVHSIFLPLCQPPLPFPYSLTRPLNLYPFCLIKTIIINPRLFLWML